MDKPPTLLGRVIEIVKIYLWLGLTAFGGPSVHVQVMLVEFVEKRKWLDATTYADIWALGAALPGPASTQLGFGIALLRYGFPLALLAFFCWSLPGAIGMLALAIGVEKIPENLPQIALHLLTGVNAAAVGLIAVSALNLTRATTSDGITRALLFISAAASTCYSAPWLYPVLTLSSGVVTLAWDQLKIEKRAENIKKTFEKHKTRNRAASADNSIEMTTLPDSPESDKESTMRSRRVTEPQSQPEASTQTQPQTSETPKHMSKRTLILCTTMLGLFALNIALPLGLKAAAASPSRALELYANLCVAGAIIFGGGPVVVPLLYGYIVEPGWTSPQVFLLGYSILQAFPGPNFNIAVYLGYLSLRSGPFLGAFLGWLALFSPGILLKAALIPFYRRFKDRPVARSIFRGLNCGATGLIFSAVYRLWIVGALLPDGKTGSLDRSGWWVVVAASAFLSNSWVRLPPWAAIGSGAISGLLYHAVVR